MRKARKLHPITVAMNKPLNRRRRKLGLAQRLAEYDESAAASAVIESALADDAQKRNAFNEANKGKPELRAWVDQQVKGYWERSRLPERNRASWIHDAMRADHVDDPRVRQLAVETVRASIRRQGLRKK